jgi:hypothetical protein
MLSILRLVCLTSNKSSLLPLLLSYPITDIDLIDSNHDMTVLQNACSRNDIESVTILLKHNPDLNVQTKKGKTALMKAIIENCHEITLLLLSQKNIKIHLCDKKGMTALHYACKHYNVCAVSLLLSYRANDSIKDNEGFDALHYSGPGASHYIGSSRQAIECLFRHAAMVRDKIEIEKTIVTQLETARKVMGNETYQTTVAAKIPTSLLLNVNIFIAVVSTAIHKRKICYAVGNSYQIWNSETGWSNWIPLPSNFYAKVEYVDHRINYHICDNQGMHVRFNFLEKEPGSIAYFKDVYIQ